MSKIILTEQTAPATPAAGTVAVYPKSDGLVYSKDDAGTETCMSSGGTVTAVALSLPSIITVSGSPVTTTGTLTGTLAAQTANRVFSGPTSGGDATPAFRALVAADLPISLSGTTNRIPKFTSSSVLGDSNWQESSGNLSSLTAGKTISVPGTGTDSEQFGLNADADGDYSSAFGKNATLSSAYVSLFGTNATVDNSSEGAVLIGASSQIQTSGPAIGIGRGVNIQNSANAVVLEYNAVANTNSNSVRIGSGNTLAASTSSVVLIGYQSSIASGANSSVVIGDGAASLGLHGVSIGFTNTAGAGSVSMGEYADAGDGSVALGSAADIFGTNSVGIGPNITIGFGASNCVALGNYASVAASSSSTMALGPGAQANGLYYTLIGSFSGTYSGATSNNMDLGGYNGSSNEIWLNLNGYQITSYKSFIPVQDNTYDLGSSYYGWSRLYLKSGIYDGSSNKSVDSTGRQLFQADGSTVTLDWTSGHLQGGTWDVAYSNTANATYGIVFPGGSYGHIYDNNSTTKSIDPNGRTLFQGDGSTVTLDYASRYLQGGAWDLAYTATAVATYGVNFSGTNSFINDGSSVKSVDPNGRQAFQSNGTTVSLDWSTQHTGTGLTTGHTPGTGNPVTDDSTFTGNTGSSAYTIGDIVAALKEYKILAA